MSGIQKSSLNIREALKELDQVYCASLIKWVVKREIIQLAELCLSRWWIKSGTWWYWISIWRYWLVLGQYKLELLGFRWYRVSKGLVCLYILEKVEIWSGVTDASHTDWQTSEYRATQLVSSIKFKLSHAMLLQQTFTEVLTMVTDPRFQSWSCWWGYCGWMIPETRRKTF